MIEDSSNRVQIRPTLRYPLGSTVVPGDRLGAIRPDLVASDGTYVQNGHMYANVVGVLTMEDSDAIRKKGEPPPKKALRYSVKVTGVSNAPQPFLPVGQVILGRVTRLTLQQAFVDILVEQRQLDRENTTTFLLHQAPPLFAQLGEGILRREDVRAGSTEQIQLHEIFRPGDLVLCRILSWGDRRYVLGTAEPALGVIRACSAVSNKPMVPVSWREMECPETGIKESRKCAKPPQQLLSLLLSSSKSA